MDTFLPAFIMAFREGLEGFLIITILLKFLEKTKNHKFKPTVWKGAFAGIAISIVLGVILMSISSYIGGLKTTAKLWESIGGFIAVILVTTFIIWMIKHGSNLRNHLESEVANSLSVKGIFLLVLFMVAREGTEIAIFSFAGKYELFPILIGLLAAAALVVLINYSLVKVNLKVIFMLTLGYLIIQAGYLFGYSIHEGLSAIKSLGWIDGGNSVFTKAFNVYETAFNHKKGILGLPLNVILGWYSKPEWIQFLVQYVFTFSLFGYWYAVNTKNTLVTINK